MTVAPQNESHGKSVQATFLKVGQNLYRNESSDTYYGLTKRGGKQFRIALRTESGAPVKDRALAERALRKWLDEIENINPATLSSSDLFAIIEKKKDETTGKEVEILVGGVAKRWLDIQRPNLKPGTIKRRDLYIRSLAPFFKEVPLLKISAAHCEEWLTKRVTKRGGKLAKITFKYELAIMRAIFRYALEQGVMAKDPSRSIKGPKGTPRKLVRKKIHIPTKEQFFALLDTIRQSGTKSKPGAKGYQGELAENQRKAKAGADLVEFLAYSGCRIGEATALRWRNVDLKAGVIRIEGHAGESEREGGTKNGLDREVPIVAPMRILLERMQAERNPRPDDFVHSIRSAKKCLITASHKLGIVPHFTHHDFRHYFVTTCLEAGVPLPTITDWIGHQDGGALALSTYKHIRKDHSLKMAAMVDFGTRPQAALIAA
jgi:integrase